LLREKKEKIKEVEEESGKIDHSKARSQAKRKKGEEEEEKQLNGKGVTLEIVGRKQLEKKIAKEQIVSDPSFAQEVLLELGSDDQINEKKKEKGSFPKLEIPSFMRSKDEITIEDIQSSNPVKSKLSESSQMILWPRTSTHSEAPYLSGILEEKAGMEEEKGNVPNFSKLLGEQRKQSEKKKKKLVELVKTQKKIGGKKGLKTNFLPSIYKIVNSLEEKHEKMIEAQGKGSCSSVKSKEFMKYHESFCGQQNDLGHPGLFLLFTSNLTPFNRKSLFRLFDIEAKNRDKVHK